MDSRSARSWLSEAAVIVGSILLAFAIDAGWERREEREIERELLLALRSEFEVNVEWLALCRSSHEQDFAAAGALLATIDSAAVDPTVELSPGVVGEMLTFHSYDPSVGVLSSIIASGELRLIRDPELRAELAGWNDRVEDLNEDERYDQAEAMRFQDLVYDFLPVRTFTAPLFEEIVPGGSRREPDYEGLYRSPYLENIAVGRRVLISNVLNEVELLEGTTARILERIDAELSS